MLPNLNDLLQHSVTKDDVEGQYHAGSPGGAGVWHFFLPMGGENQMWGMLPPEPPPYWSVDRDRVLRYTTIKAQMWAQAVGIACAKQASLSFELEAEASPMLVKRAQQMMLALDGTSYTLGVERGVRDYVTTDNGEFWEIVRVSSAAGSRTLGLMHLDSLRCIRTGDDEIPLVYRDLRGRYHELQQHEVIMMADMPSASAELFGVGLCAASRAYGKIVFMDSIDTYFNEKITGRKANEIHLVNNVSEKTLRTGITSAEAQNTQEGYMVYKNVVVIPVYSENAVTGYKIEVAGVPDGFDHKTERDIANLEFANALGLDLQDLQPLSGQGLGTGAQSHVQAEKSKSKTLSVRMKQFAHEINQKFLPDVVTFIFAEIDLTDEEKKGNISKVHADTRAVQVQSGEITAVEARALAVEADDLPAEMKPAIPNAIDDTLSDEEQPDAIDTDENGNPLPVSTQQPVDGSPTDPSSIEMTILNGSQIESAINVLAGVTAGTIAELAAVELLASLGINKELAKQMVEASRNVTVAPQAVLQPSTSTTDAVTKAKRILHTHKVLSVDDDKSATLKEIRSTRERVLKQLKAHTNQETVKADILNAVNEALDKTHQEIVSLKQSQAPVSLMIDEAVLRRVAEETAEMTANKMSVVSQDITQRDDEGNALIVRKTMADGSTHHYHVYRNADGSIETVKRIDYENNENALTGKMEAG